MTLITKTGQPVNPGDFAPVHETGKVAFLIHVGEILDGGFEDYEHAITYIGGKHDLILEAEPSGAKILPFRMASISMDNCLWSTQNSRLDLTPLQRSRVASVCGSLAGIGYSYLDYFAIAAHRLHIPAPGLQTYIAASGHQICSQMVDYVRLRLGFHLFDDGRWEGYITPADLAGLILS